MDRYDSRTSNNYEIRTSSSDEPPNSRLFIIANKRLNESDFRDAFAKFGEIEDIWVVKDRRSGENKGVTYIKYAKTSEAALAMEAMNGKIIVGSDRHIKVMIASNRNKGSQREENEDEKIQRLFVLVPKTMTEAELESYFGQFGDIDYVNIVRDKETRESKGLGYIKYYKFSHAAKAFEECDRKYRAVFSEPRKNNSNRNNNNTTTTNNNNSNNASNDYQQTLSTITTKPFQESSIGNGDKFKIMVLGSPQLTEEQVWRLFNIIPGMEYCQWRYDTIKRRHVGTVVYSSFQWATHAIDKLNGFEYPIGSRLLVKPDGTVPRQDTNRTSQISIPSKSNIIPSSNIIELYETLNHATAVIQNVVLTPGTRIALSPHSDISEICSVQLPEPQALASIDADTAARCFIVCTPPPPSQAILKDLFCRFGNLIEVYLLSHKNCGYAKYATKESAMEAITVLHGAEVSGGRIKVIEADERGNNSRKRLRLDDQ
ncbi:PREDICTED: RNA-binding protein 45 isoform X2 [Nicrophorus vespilloides]|uniref:RNA-binding protein 45 isoform X2 n=1 Tax=Nicrophorus vespilloides TaxID=110193 RepID=A0ABM1MH71_NICVS|nr:PREDICTED: RNA-binding protein 45 isoform X2 [Nicrophorus vespilloides]